MSDTTTVMSNSSIPSSASILTTAQSNSIFSVGPTLIGLVWFETAAAGFAYGLGLIGNILSLMIFYSQKDFRNVSTGLLFIFIAISNLFHLFTLAVEFLTVYGVVVFRQGIYQCQLNYLIQNISRAMSTYLMVTIAIDRLIRSELPMRSKLICTKRNTIFVTCFYLIIFTLYWSFYFFPYITQDPVTGGCSFKKSPTLYYYITYLYIPIRAILICFVPVLIMLAANIRMLINIRESRRRVTNGTTLPSSGVDMTIPNGSNSKERPSRRLSALDRMLYYMMVANVSIFIITQLPFHIYSCARNSIVGLDSLTASLIRAMLLMWSSLYFGIAFYFYCLASPLFREKFIKMAKKTFCFRKMPQSHMGTTMAIS